MEAGTQNEKEQKLETKKTGMQKFLSGFMHFLMYGGIYRRSGCNCCDCDSHLIFDEVKRLMSKSARRCILLAKGYRE